ncbi:M16 family metallopeptidase [Humidisolicoccus flavus]|uniref:M16 family metallopeptidase n=1 Tax=Humidisolicoccus flavus TaxID=3111414 RepID=UPI0032511069
MSLAVPSAQQAAIPFALEQPELTIQSSAGSIVRRTVLENGVRILSEQIPAAMSATIGFWVPVGSRDEQPRTFGSTHFLEHLLFKGTTQSSAFDIAIAFDSVGGEHNALTAKEHTCYYAKVRDADVPMATRVIADMVIDSVLDAEEFEIERGVILEELAMADDDPGDVAGERLAELVYGAHPLGRPIGGTPATIAAVGRDDVAKHYQEHYVPSNLVVTVAGAVDHDELVALVRAALEARGWGQSVGAPNPRRSTTQQPISGGGTTVVQRPLEQINLMIGMPGLVATDPRRHEFAVLNSILGGGMSSRLFQEIRERRGLAYSVYTFGSAHSDAGMFGMYAGCSPKNAVNVAELMVAELESVARAGVTNDELARAKGQLGGASALALEDSDSRMSRLGRAELTLGEFVDLETMLGRLDAVSANAVQELAGQLLVAERSVAAVGTVEPNAFDGLSASSRS